MTRDNLRKRHIIKPLDCVYCLEQESCSHLFFECIVAKHLWAHIEEYFSSQIGSSFESVARFWIATKKCSVLNTVSSAVLWCLWKYRNAMIFSNTSWISIPQVLRLIRNMVRNWAILSSGSDKDKLMSFVETLTRSLQKPLAITCGWTRLDLLWGWTRGLVSRSLMKMMGTWRRKRGTSTMLRLPARCLRLLTGRRRLTRPLGWRPWRLRWILVSFECSICSAFGTARVICVIQRTCSSTP